MKKIKIAVVCTYPPRECGIGTFSKNLINALQKQHECAMEIFVVAMQSPKDEYEFPEIVQYVIRQEHQRDYINAAEYINFSGADICLIQHEYGIYGGESGVFLLSLIHELSIPFYATLHTILETPSFNEKSIIKNVASKAVQLIVMSEKAVSFLTNCYGVAAEKITLIQHGVPDFNIKYRESSKTELNLQNKKVLLTFGLLNRNKGIETVIKALPDVVRKHNDVIYVIMGKTHPMVKMLSGEEYRNYLLRLIEKANIEKYIHFYDKFVTESELIKYLSAADVYVTPYLNKRQITSGTLSYAVGAGAAVLSTPYWHAEEMLAQERGFLFDFGNYSQLSELLLKVLDNPDLLKKTRERAYTYGRKIIWPVIGLEYIKLFNKQSSSLTVNNAGDKEIFPINPAHMPVFSLDHIKRLTDNTGIIQHARYSIPNLKEGYCTDDNARALILSLIAYRQKADNESFRLMEIYLKFLMYMQNDDGTFRNFLSFDKKFLDEKGTDDSFGRAIWALGYLVHYSSREATFSIGLEMFNKSLPQVESIRSIRAIAFCAIGLSYFLYRFPDNEFCSQLLSKKIKCIIDAYDAESGMDWKWFEPVIAYANGIIPLALLHAYNVLRVDRYKLIAFESIAFLEKIKFSSEYLRVIGNEGWYPRGGKPALYAQQPVNAMAMVLLFHKAYSVTKDKAWLVKMFKAYKWFLGDNFLHMPLYDFETKGCNDGLEKDRVSRNQGAESTIAYWISHIDVLIAHEEMLYNHSRKE